MKQQDSSIKPGDIVGFQFAEEGNVCRYGEGPFVEYDHGGMAVVEFEHSSSRVTTVPWAIKKVKR